MASRFFGLEVRSRAEDSPELTIFAAFQLTVSRVYGVLCGFRQFQHKRTAAPYCAMNTQDPIQTIPGQRSPALIYVVDDSAELGDMVGLFLARAGYEARVFSDPLKALSEMEAGNAAPRLLISDFRMPGINGLELIQRCKAIHPSLKVIAASANILDEELDKYPYVPDKILTKPYTTTALMVMVKDMLAD